MNIEIIEFYPIQLNNGLMAGTLKIKLLDMDVFIRGIQVSKNRAGKYFFSLPWRIGIDPETGEKVRYPIFVFEDREKQRALIEAIKLNAPAFIEKKYINGTNPIVSPQNKKIETFDVRKQNQNDAATTTTKQRPITSLAHKNFIDPPKRTTLLPRNRKNG